MDWTQALTIIGIFSAFFIYLISKVEKLTDKVNSVKTRISVLENEIKNTNQRLISIDNYLIPKKILRFEDHCDGESKEN